MKSLMGCVQQVWKKLNAFCGHYSQLSGAMKKATQGVACKVKDVCLEIKAYANIHLDVAVFISSI